MKSTDQFKAIINNYLNERAKEDPLFAVTYAKPHKNIDDCITYILNEVHKSKRCGFADDEIFGMAVHYYDEDDVEVGERKNCRIVTNRKSEPEDKEETENEPPVKIPKPIKSVPQSEQLSLFA